MVDPENKGIAFEPDVIGTVDNVGVAVPADQEDVVFRLPALSVTTL